MPFDSVPKRWLAYESGYADMEVALGHCDDLVAVGNLGRYHTQSYEEFESIVVDAGNLT